MAACFATVEPDENRFLRSPILISRYYILIRVGACFKQQDALYGIKSGGGLFEFNAAGPNYQVQIEVIFRYGSCNELRQAKAIDLLANKA